MSCDIVSNRVIVGHRFGVLASNNDANDAVAEGLVASNDIVIRRTNQDNTGDTIPARHIILDHRSR